jgi:UDP-glucose 4-epimerase
MPLESLLHESEVTVTGSGGFIGSHLVRKLLNLGVSRLVAIDHLRYGTWENLADIAHHPALVLKELDFAQLDIDELKKLLGQTNFLFHLAAEKHNQSIGRPELIIAVNIAGTQRLFQAAAAVGVQKIVFTSSLYVYGRMTAPIMKEVDLPQPRTIYGISKLAGEHLLRVIEYSNSVTHCSLRLFFVYGPRQFAGQGYKSVIVSNFERILRGESPVIYGDGEQVLDYVFVDDVVEALIKAVVTSSKTGLFNISSGQLVSINQLTNLMLEVSDNKMQPIYKPADWTAGTSRSGNNTLARTELDWYPKVSLREGLAQVYDWMKTNG